VPETSVNWPWYGHALAEVCDLHASVVGSLPTAERDDAPIGDAASATFEPVATAPREARRFAHEVVDRWGVSTAADDVTLIVSELVANAILHAGSPSTVRLSHRPSVVRVEVSDGEPTSIPSLRRFSPTATSGRGLRMVAAVAAGWGAYPIAGGKVIWADIELAGHAGG
jgi:hypothetical protein